MKKTNKIKTLNSFEHLGQVLIPQDAIQSTDGAKNNPKYRELTPDTQKWADENITVVYLDPMTEQQRELQYGAVVDPYPPKDNFITIGKVVKDFMAQEQAQDAFNKANSKRVSLIAKHNNRRW